MPQRLDASTVDRKLNAAQKRAEAAKLRSRGRTWQQIADAVGYSSTGSANAAVREYFKRYPPTADADELREQMNAELDQLASEAWAVLEKYHPFIQHGKVVGRFTGKWLRDEYGEVMVDHKDKPIPELEDFEDSGPVLQAMSTILRIMERRAKLNGLDKPVKIEIQEHAGVDAEIEELWAQMNAAAMPQLPDAHPESVGGSDSP